MSFPSNVGTQVCDCCDECDCPDPGSVATGTGAVTVSGTPPSTTATSGTGLVSTDNYYSWDGVGADGVAIGTPGSSSVSGTTTGGVGFTATLSGTGHLERRNSTFPSYITNFSPGEPLLFAQSDPASPPTYPGDIIIEFSEQVSAAGFRVSQAQTTFRDDFFIHAYSGGSLITLAPPTAGDNLFVDATIPANDSAPFYGIYGCFDKLVVGFTGSINSGPGQPYAIGTLEVLTC